MKLGAIKWFAHARVVRTYIMLQVKIFNIVKLVQLKNTQIPTLGYWQEESM